MVKKKPAPAVLESVPAFLRDAHKHDTVQASLNRAEPIDVYVSDLLDRTAYDLERREPAPIFSQGPEGFPVPSGTDLDGFTLYRGLAQRGSVINIPAYERMRTVPAKRTQRVVSSENRHGRVIRVVSHKNLHSFSLTINDYNVIEFDPTTGKETVGAPRNFALVDYAGRMHEGFSRVEFRATDEERQRLERYGAKRVDGAFEVRDFVAPQMAMLVYSPDFIAAKALAQRCEEEARHYRRLAEDLRKDGVRLGGTRRMRRESESAKPPAKKIGVMNFQTRVILPKPHGEFRMFGLTPDHRTVEYSALPGSLEDRQDVLRYAEGRARRLSYVQGPEVRSFTRAVELAFLRYGYDSNGRERVPSWLNGQWTTWKNGWKWIRASQDVSIGQKLTAHTATVRESALQGFAEGLILADN